jgi:hypothetical protein
LIASLAVLSKEIIGSAQSRFNDASSSMFCMCSQGVGGPWLRHGESIAVGPRQI